MTVQIHQTVFLRNTFNGQWKATCSCGWFQIGDRAEVLGAAAVHDIAWVVEPVDQPAAVSP